MKVAIWVRFKSASGERYNGQSGIIEWSLPIPKKGELLTINPGQTAIPFIYNKGGQKAIEGNCFTLIEKQYKLDSIEMYLILTFG